MKEWWFFGLVAVCMTIWVWSILEHRRGRTNCLVDGKNDNEIVTHSHSPPHGFEDFPMHRHMNRVDGRLYVGDFHGASELLHDEQMAAMWNVTAVVNVAWDYDMEADQTRMQGTVSGSNLRYRIRYGKVGLIDGPGNSQSSLETAVRLLASFVQEDGSEPSFLPKDAHIYARPRNGSVLVHCVFGQSRSVTVAALYLYYSGRFSTLEDALDWIRSRRHLSAERYPQRDLLKLAQKLVKEKPVLRW